VTSVEQFRSAFAHPVSREVAIAGVLWPAYKVVALVVGLVVLAVVGAATAGMAAGVLSGAAASTALWVVLGIAHHWR
jgi:hypothetical protein